MRQLNPSLFRAYITSGLVILVIILIVPLVLLPQLSKIKEKNLEVKKGQERLERLNKKIAALDEIDESEESLQLFEVEKAVPSDKKLAELIIGVRNLAGQAGLRIMDMNFKPGKVSTAAAAPKQTKATTSPPSLPSGQQEDKLTFTTKLEGDQDVGLDQIKNFLTSLEKAKRLLGVNSIMTSRNESDQTYSFDLEVVTPVKPVKSCNEEATVKGTTACPDIVAEPLPPYTSVHQQIFDILAKFVDYTNIVVPLVPTGVDDPFK